MTDKLETLEQRRLGLLERCAEQRRTLSFHAHSVGEATSRLDSAMGVLRRIKQHPALLVLLVAGIAIVRPQRVAALAKATVVGLRALNSVAPVVQNLMHRQQHRLQ